MFFEQTDNINFKTIFKDYFISISLNEEEISLLIYNISILDNIRYEMNLDLNDMKNLSANFNNMNLIEIYNALRKLIEKEKLNLEFKYNDLILSFLMKDFEIEENDNTGQIQLILFGERDNNEYLFYLTEEINKLRYTINELTNRINNQTNQNPNQMNIINQNIINNNPNINIPKVTIPETNTSTRETDSDDFFNKLNIDINDNIQELCIDKKLIDDKIFIHLNKYGLNKLTRLSLSYNKLETIKGIENCNFPNLESIHLNNNTINNLSFLSEANFPQLKRLWLNSNAITDLSPLADSNFPKLNTLSLSFNDIKDISPLKDVNFPELKILALDNNNISDLSVFQYTKFKLEKIGLNDNKIVDISVFEFGNFKDLTKLYLYNNQIVDISSFSRANLEKLTCLSLKKNKINDLSFLDNPLLKELKELYLSDNQINDLSVFDRINIGFSKLYIDGNTFDINTNSKIINSLKSKIEEFHYNKEYLNE